MLIVKLEKNISKVLKSFHQRSQHLIFHSYSLLISVYHIHTYFNENICVLPKNIVQGMALF